MAREVCTRAGVPPRREGGSAAEALGDGDQGSQLIEQVLPPRDADVDPLAHRTPVRARVVELRGGGVVGVLEATTVHHEALLRLPTLGQLERLHAWVSRHAGPVCCNGWFDGVLRQSQKRNGWVGLKCEQV